MLPICVGLTSLQERPGSRDEAIKRMVDAYDAGAPPASRSGTARALKACAAQLGPTHVPFALDFLLGTGLADVDDDVRAEMVAAGAVATSCMQCGPWQTCCSQMLIVKFDF